MSGSRADWRKGGRAGRPKKLSPVCREDVGTSTIVQGKGRGEMGGGEDRQIRGNIRSSMRNSKIIGGIAVSYQYETPIHPYYQVLPDAQVYWGEISSAGMSGSQSGASS